jgi:SAM-dependent methyltransferase
MTSFLKRLFGGTQKSVPPDTEEIRQAVRARYAGVACCAEGQFRYPTGLAGAEALGYETTFIAEAPAGMLASFCGVGNPFDLGKIEEGAAVLDIGCGAGFDLLCAARLAGPTGKVTGIDLTPEMAAKARQNLDEAGLKNVDVREGLAEELPFDDNSFDVVISNGVLNLSPDKERLFSEIHRVLRPGGRLQFADVVLKEELPPAQMSATAWSE